MSDKNHNSNVFEKPKTATEIVLGAHRRLSEAAVQGFGGVHYAAYITDPSMVLQETGQTRPVLNPETVQIDPITTGNYDEYPPQAAAA